MAGTRELEVVDIWSFVIIVPSVFISVESFVIGTTIW